MFINQLVEELSFSNWRELTKSIRGCDLCDSFEDLLPFDDALQLPNPLEYNSRLEILMIAWAPPGTRVAVNEHHFFHNPKSPDKMRSKIFNIINQVLPDAALDPRNPEISLERFYKMGLYLVPTIFRRIRNDKNPRTAIVTHSAQAHLLPIVQHLLSSSDSMKSVLFGTTPSRAFATLFDDQDNGRKLGGAISKGLAEARKLTKNSPMLFEIADGRFMEVWISNWPRGKGYANLKRDLRRILCAPSTLIPPSQTK